MAIRERGTMMYLLGTALVLGLALCFIEELRTPPKKAAVGGDDDDDE